VFGIAIHQALSIAHQKGTRVTSDVYQQLQSVIDDSTFGGTIGIATRSFQTGEEIEINADMIFPTASTFKTVLLYELYRQVDQGRIDPSDRITIEDRHRVPGSGVIQDLDAGASLTIRDVATLMMVISDNAGTDIIFDLLGSDAIQQAVRDLGMSSTSIPMGTWGLLCGLQNLDPDDPELTYEAVKALLKGKDAPWDANAFKETPDNDITTPRDMIRLHVAIEHGEGLSPESRDAVLDIMKRQKLSERIPAHLPTGVVCAHKTGSLRGVRNDAGIVYALDGTSYAVAIFVKGATDGVAGTRLVGDVSKVIYEHYVGPIG
jgi:beta-lactamase class A